MIGSCYDRQRMTTGYPTALGARIGFLLSRAHLIARERADIALAELGLSMKGFAALATLVSDGPVSQQRLSARIRMDPATMVDVIQRAADQCFMPLTVGGGIKSVDDMFTMLRAGADKISINSSALARPELIREGAEKFGSQCIVVSIDARKVGPDKWEVFSHGGRKNTGLDAVAWAKRAVALGAGEIVLNSIDADGTKAGFDLVITRRISESVGVPVVASGGAGTLEHMAAVLLEGKADAVLAASIFHFGTYTVGDVKQFLAEKKIPVRL